MSPRLAFLAGLATAVAIGAVLTYALLYGRIGARTDPSRMEAWLARAARHWAIPAEERARTNPVVLTPAVLTEARAHFADHCAACHGNDGRGDTEMGRNLSPRAPDMRRPATQRLSDGEIFYVIENGIRLTGMPAWGKPGSQEESWKLVHLVRQLPRLTPEEIAEMERLNPRSASEWRELEDEERFLRGEDDGGRQPEAQHGH